jgi:hypothetical protein
MRAHVTHPATIMNLRTDSEFNNILDEVISSVFDEKFTGNGKANYTRSMLRENISRPSKFWNQIKCSFLTKSG